MSKIKFLLIGCVLLCCTALYSQNKHYEYQTVPNDPMNVKIYTMQNGLKVYMSVNKDLPRIQTYIAVKAGSKNDPAQTTGLAHYLEHLMFKGTSRIGTLDWEKESVLLDQIERQFEVYRSTKEPEKRDSIYKVIDKLSYEASGYAIPNEYVKLMKHIGSTGTNAWTSNDNTVFIENIPSNQLENWAMIESERFQDPVIRLFHTELETVYEEKNRSLTNDSRKAREALMAALFPDHPYGTQTTLGTEEHLKNPSIQNIKQFVKTYYVPNNMCIVLSGDFNPDEAVSILEKYFGEMQPSDSIPRRDIESHPIEYSKEKAVKVSGLEAESVTIGYRIGKPANATEIYLLRMMDYIMNNGKCGLIDLDINQKQRTASASSSPMILCDNSAFILNGKPKKGQSLKEVCDLLMREIEIVKSGNFDDTLMTGAINNMRLQEMQQQESASKAASLMLSAFTNNIQWDVACHSVDYFSQITKKDIIEFAQKYFVDNNRVIVYKEQTETTDVQSVAKPAITPIQINRDVESDFFKKIKAKEVTPIAPVYTDYKKSIQRGEAKSIPLYCVKNTTNATFSLKLVYPVGELMNKVLPIAASYAGMVGTEKHTAEDVRRLFYQMACNFSVYCSDKELTFSLSGLSENLEPAFNLMMEVIQNAKPDEEIFRGMIDNRIKKMEDAKKQQDNVLSALRIYCEYGPELVNYSLKPGDMRGLNSEGVLETLRMMLQYQPVVRFYGPQSVKQLKKMLLKDYVFPSEYATPPLPLNFIKREVTQNEVFFVPYNAKQSRLVTYSRGPIFNKEMLASSKMYNGYFGGGMDAIVFQEMREKRSLAYTARSSYIIESDTNSFSYNYSFIGTQNDKIIDAWTAFDELFNEMPVSETSFNLAKEKVLTDIATTRYTKEDILNTYFANKKIGYDYDYRKDIYNAVKSFTIDNVIKFNQQYVKGKPQIRMILAREKDIDLYELQDRFGTLQKLDLNDIFGY